METRRKRASSRVVQPTGRGSEESPAKKTKSQDQSNEEAEGENNVSENNNNSSSSSDKNAKEQLEAFTKTIALGVPVSTILSISSLAKQQDQDHLGEIFEGLVQLAETMSSSDKAVELQRSLLDIVEFLSVAQEQLAARDRERLALFRKLVVRFEELVNKHKSSGNIDYRVFSLFMENKLGDVTFKNGPICSEFNKIKSKLSRGTMFTWEERDEIIEKLLSNVSDKRRSYLVEGRAEVRGYSDMSDQELKGWSTLAGELLSE